MKRAGVLLVVLLMVAALAYGLGVAQQESAYRALIAQGDAALTRDDSFAAIEVFTVAISKKPDSMAAHLKRGEAYRRRHEYEAALRDLRTAIELDPLAPHPREILGDVNYEMGRYVGAVDRYREYLAVDDRSPRVLYKQALAFVKLGQTTVAATSLRQALVMDSRFAEAHYLLGVCLREMQKPAEALKELEHAVALKPGLLQAREELAELYGSLERYVERNRQLEALAVFDPSASREVALALGYARDDQVERAVLRLRSAARQFPDEVHMYVALGRLWLERAQNGGGRVEVSKAILALESAVVSDSTSEAHTLYGRALMMAGELGRAESELQQAIVRYPVDSLAFYYLADVAERRGHLTIAHRALIDYTALEGLESPRLDARLLARLAEAHLRAGDIEAARQALERARQKDPDNTHVRALALRIRS